MNNNNNNSSIMNWLSPLLLLLLLLQLSVVFQSNDGVAVDAFQPTMKSIISSGSSKSVFSMVEAPRKAASYSLLDDSSSSSSLSTQTAVSWPTSRGKRKQQDLEQQQQHQGTEAAADTTNSNNSLLNVIDFKRPEKLANAMSLDTSAFCSLLEKELKKYNNKNDDDDDDPSCWLVTGMVNPALFSHDFVYTCTDPDNVTFDSSLVLLHDDDCSRQRHGNGDVSKNKSCNKAEMVSMRVKKSYFNNQETITVTWRLSISSSSLSGNKAQQNLLLGLLPTVAAAAAGVVESSSPAAAVRYVYTDYVRDLHTGLICRQHDHYDSAIPLSSSSSSSWKVLMDSVLSPPSLRHETITRTILEQRKAAPSTPSSSSSPSRTATTPPKSSASLQQDHHHHHKPWTPSPRIIVPTTSDINNNSNSHIASQLHHQQPQDHIAHQQQQQQGYYLPPLQEEEEEEEHEKPALSSWAASSGFHAYFRDRSSGSSTGHVVDAAASSGFHAFFADRSSSTGNTAATTAAAASTRHDRAASQRKTRETREQQRQQQLNHQQRDALQVFSEMIMGHAKETFDHLVKSNKHQSSTTAITQPNNPFLRAAADAVEVIVVTAATALGTASATASGILLDTMSKKNEGGGGGHTNPFQAGAAAFDAVAAVTGANKNNIGPNRLQAVVAKMENMGGGPKKNPLEQALAATLTANRPSSSPSSLSSTISSWLNVTSFLQTSGETLLSWHHRHHHHDDHREHYPLFQQLQLQQVPELHERQSVDDDIVTKTRRIVSKTRRVIKHEVVDYNDELSPHQVYASSPEFSIARTISLESPFFLQHVQKLQDEEQDDDDDDEQDYVLPVVLPRIKPPSVLDHVKSFVPAADHKAVIKSLQWATERTESRRREWHEERQRYYDAHHQAQLLEAARPAVSTSHLLLN